MFFFFQVIHIFSFVLCYYNFLYLCYSYFLVPIMHLYIFLFQNYTFMFFTVFIYFQKYTSMCFLITNYISICFTLFKIITFVFPYSKLYLFFSYSEIRSMKLCRMTIHKKCFFFLPEKFHNRILTRKYMY